MLNGFLQHTLHLTVGLAHRPCEVSHLPHIYLAEGHKHGYDAHNDKGQRVVHGKEVEEGSEEQCQHRQRVGQRLGKKVYHRVHINLQAVEHVARVQSLLSAPLRAQYAVKHTLLHAVLCFNAQNVTHPYCSYVEGKVGEDKQSHHAHRPVDVAWQCARRNVDGVLYGPYLCQCYHHLCQPYGGVQRGLRSVSAPCSPQPHRRLPSGVARRGNM